MGDDVTRKQVSDDFYLLNNILIYYRYLFRKWDGGLRY